MKIAIISSCSLPVPAVSGGAVESLIESIVKENEESTPIDLCVYALYDATAKAKIQSYPHTTFKFFEKKTSIEAMDKAITQVMRLVVGGKDIASRNYIWKIMVLNALKQELKKEHFDKIVLQNTIFLFNIFKDKELYGLYKGKVYFHVHNSLTKRVGVDYKELLVGIISISDYLHNNIRAYFDDTVRIKTVHNGIDCKNFLVELSQDEKKMMLRKYHISPDSHIIVFVGRIAPEKGVRETIAAFNKVKIENCELLIVGASYFGSGAISPFESEIMQAIEKNPRIHMTGFVGKDNIWKYYKLGDVAILPSMWEEPLGLTMIEAQAAGIPLITTRMGGIPETVDGRYSVLLDKDENIVDQMRLAIEDILGNPVDWNEKARKAQKQVMVRFNEKVFYDSFIETLRELGDMYNERRC